MDSKELALKCAELASDKKGKDIVVLHVEPQTVLADYFVIVTANNDRHAASIIDEVSKELKAVKKKAMSRQGYEKSGWVLMDLGAVVVHVFLEHIRKHYDLEELWQHCESVDFDELQVSDEN